MMITLMFLCILGFGVLSFKPMKSLLMLEFVYLCLTCYLLEVGVWNWWIMLIILFSACEGVFLLSVFMIISNYEYVKFNKFFFW